MRIQEMLVPWTNSPRMWGRDWWALRPVETSWNCRYLWHISQLYYVWVSFNLKTPSQIQVDEQGKIVDARFKTFGCGSAIASSSLATEWIKGKSVSAAMKDPNLASQMLSVHFYFCYLGNSVFFLLSGRWSLHDKEHRHCQRALSSTS